MNELWRTALCATRIRRLPNVSGDTIAYELQSLDLQVDSELQPESQAWKLRMRLRTDYRRIGYYP